jgi:hypothetical protein
MNFWGMIDIGPFQSRLAPHHVCLSGDYGGYCLLHTTCGGMWDNWLTANSMILLSGIIPALRFLDGTALE